MEKKKNKYLCNLKHIISEQQRYLQSFAKYIWKLLGFTENLDLK